MDPVQEILGLLDEAGEKVENFAGRDDADRAAQFASHLATCRMAASELHGATADSTDTQE